MWASWLSFVLGVWLIIAPLVFRYAERAARFNEILVGLAVAIVALIASSRPALRFVNVALGGWLLLAPLVLGYGDSTLPTAHDIVMGALVICAAILSAPRPAARNLRRLART